MVNKKEISTDHSIHILSALDEVYDPEIPVLTIAELGILREIKINDKDGMEETEIVITPTYTGCPAMDMIAINIRLVLTGYGFKNIKITTVLSPAWTTDWITDNGKEKLKRYGIAPPLSSLDKDGQTTVIQCPQCRSDNVHLISQFGSTACKALYKCDDCKEPFDYFKCH